MSSILVTPAAENDLTEIWLYIAEDNPLAADRVFEAAQSTFDNLLQKPKIRIQSSYLLSFPGVETFLPLYSV